MLSTKKVWALIIFPLVLLILLVTIKSLTPKYSENDEYIWHREVEARDEGLLIRGNKIDSIKSDINKLIYAINRSERDPEIFRTPNNKEPKDPPKLKLI